MALHVLYIEDREGEFDLLKKVVDENNENLPIWSKVILSPVNHPSELPKALVQHPDVVLADVYFPSVDGPKEKDYLDEIIQHVKEWDGKSPHGFPTPVIAYTGKGRPVLENCLKRRGSLYDIWDKMSADVNYVAWRFQRLAAELPRYRPDATIQKLIAGMESSCCPKWHQHVLNLVRSYGEGQTEYEQIRKCRDPLQSILNEVNARHSASLMALWVALADSEPLLRSVAPKLRGIARHSINVFWFGYWLINHQLLRDEMSKLWKQMVDRRDDALGLKSIDAIEGLNAVWVLASLFHDAGKFHEHGKTITEKSGEFFQEFSTLEMGCPKWMAGETEALRKTLEPVFFRLTSDPADQMVQELKRHITSCSEKEHPDHGAVAAAYLLNIRDVSKSKDLFSEYAGEAARAVLLHSCLPSVFHSIPKDKRESCPHIEWQRDPVASLLLFCDQIQTWDRYDPAQEKKDYPERAELSYLEVEGNVESGKPQLKGCIDYITPSRVHMYPELQKDMATSLNKVILEKPKDTLLHVLQENHWPFSVRLDCALSGDKLNIGMDFT